MCPNVFSKRYCAILLHSWEQWKVGKMCRLCLIRVPPYHTFLLLIKWVIGYHVAYGFPWYKSRYVADANQLFIHVTKAKPNHAFFFIVAANICSFHGESRLPKTIWHKYWLISGLCCRPIFIMYHMPNASGPKAQIADFCIGLRRCIEQLALKLPNTFSYSAVKVTETRLCGP